MPQNKKFESDNRKVRIIEAIGGFLKGRGKNVAAKQGYSQKAQKELFRK